MGSNAAETLREIEEVKARLTQDIDALESRLPDREVMVQQATVAGGAVLGVGVGLAVLVSFLRRRAAEKERRREARINAEELAKAFHQVQPVTATVQQRTVSGKSGPMALVAALAALTLTVIQFLRSRQGTSGGTTG